MGTWDGGLYDSDEALDVRDVFFQSLRHGHPLEETRERALTAACSFFDDQDDAQLFTVGSHAWAALGDMLWHVGHLSDELASRVRSVLATDEVPEQWLDARVHERWQAELAELMARLATPQPAAWSLEALRARAWELIGAPAEERFGAYLQRSECGVVRTEQAAAILGISPAEVEVLVQSGTLEAESVLQGAGVSLLSVLAVQASGVSPALPGR